MLAVETNYNAIFFVMKLIDKNLSNIGQLAMHLAFYVCGSQLYEL